MKISAPGSGSSQRPWLRPAPATLPERYFFIAALNLILFSYDLVPCGSLFQLSDTQTLKLIKLYFLISSLARGICKLQSRGLLCCAFLCLFSFAFFKTIYLASLQYLRALYSFECSVSEPPLFWAATAPAPDGQCPGADSGSGSDLLGSAQAPGKKRRLQLHN